MRNKFTIKTALPVLLGFFVMGLVDLVGISTNYVKQDFALSDTLANLLPMSLFLWFAVLSVPTGIMLNKLGRKRTVMLSMLISLLAMLLPLVYYNFAFILVAFGLLGIGNTIIQVALNPLLTDVVSEDRLTSSLTLGQFIKAIAAFLGPIIAGVAAGSFGNWRLVFLFFGLATILIGIWLFFTPIAEKPVTQQEIGFAGSFGLLKDAKMLMLFLGIVFAVGIDVGLNTTVPKFLIERCNIPLEQAGLGTSLYFVARTIGTFLGAILLVKMSGRKFFIGCMIVAIPSMIIMLMVGKLWVILGMVFILGFSIANVFPIIFSAALKRKPSQANEVSGLLIMGIAGGAVILLIMGIISDSLGQTGGLAVLLVVLVYLLFNAFKLKEN